MSAIRQPDHEASVASLLQHARAAIQAAAPAEALPFAERAWALSPPAAGAAQRIEAGQVLCLVLYRLGQWSDLLHAAEALLPLLERPEQVASKVELLRWMTLAGCETARFDLGLRCANQACELAEASGRKTELALAMVALAICLERIGDPWQGLRLMEDALRLAEEAGQIYPRLVILNNLCATCIGTFHFMRDTESADADAVAVLRRGLVHARAALALLPQVPGSEFFSVFVESNLAEVLVHLGELDEAEPLLDGALRRVEAQGNHIHGWRARCVVGELLIFRGRPQAARDQLTALHAEMQGAEQRNTLLRLHHALYRAHRALGESLQALEHLEGYERLERGRVVAQLKAQSQLFVTRVEAERARLEAQAERRRAAEFEADAQLDQLTGLGNRRHLDRQVPALLAAAEEAGRPITVALMDLDHFKQVNDRFGHAVGDKVLVHLARMLSENIRGGDVLARIGGEEFLIAFADTPLNVAIEVCERLRSRVARHEWAALAPGLAVTLSIGVAAAPPYVLEALFERADQALYRAKSGGRNQVAQA
jgi:diguanylate cyclase (GGDEF)-like protein